LTIINDLLGAMPLTAATFSQGQGMDELVN
jgi:hypothetical protein